MTLNDLFDLSFAGRRDMVALEWNDRRLHVWRTRRARETAPPACCRRELCAGRPPLRVSADSLTVIDLYLACVNPA